MCIKKYYYWIIDKNDRVRIVTKIIRTCNNRQPQYLSIITYIIVTVKNYNNYHMMMFDKLRVNCRPFTYNFIREISCILALSIFKRVVTVYYTNE